MTGDTEAVAQVRYELERLQQEIDHVRELRDDLRHDREAGYFDVRSAEMRHRILSEMHLRFSAALRTREGAK